MCLSDSLYLCRGIGMGVTFQLSTAECCRDYINTRGFAWGSGENNTLLGFNVIGTIIAWGLAGISLLENAEGSNLIMAAAHGNNIVKVIQKALKPLDRILGGRFDKTNAIDGNAVVRDDDIMTSGKAESVYEDHDQMAHDHARAV